jgi:hypothetical protein
MFYPLQYCLIMFPQNTERTILSFGDNVATLAVGNAGQEAFSKNSPDT